MSPPPPTTPALPPLCTKENLHMNYDPNELFPIDDWTADAVHIKDYLS